MEYLLEKYSQIEFFSWRKVDRERLTIGSFLAHRFGLRIFTRGAFSKIFRNMLAMIFSVLLNLMFLGSRIMKLGSEGVYMHEKCGTNPSRHLPGLKTPREKLKKSDFGV